MTISESGISRRDLLRTGLAGAAVATVGGGTLLDASPARASAPARTAKPRLPGAATLTLRVRPNIMDVSANEKKRMVKGYKALKEMSSPWSNNVSYYDQFVLWHKKTLAWQNGMAHMGPAIWPWHRQLLLLFEAAMQEAMDDADFNLPYWDWTDSDALDVVFADDFMGPDGDPDENFKVTEGPFAGAQKWRLNVIPSALSDPWQFRAIRRRFGTPGDIVLPGGQSLPNPGLGLPTQADIDELNDVPNYDVMPYDTASDVTQSFRNALEGWKNYSHMECGSDGQMVGVSTPTSQVILHSQVHVWVGGIWQSDDPDAPYQGSMVPNTSPNDPVFFIHHCNADRVWWDWQQINGVDNFQPEMGAHTGHNLHDEMWPYCDPKVATNSTPEDTLDIEALGYTYG